jgi:hypothetical protein
MTNFELKDATYFIPESLRQFAERVIIPIQCTARRKFEAIERIYSVKRSLARQRFPDRSAVRGDFLFTMTAHQRRSRPPAID